MANFLQNAVSSFGSTFNLPTVFDWDTNAARADARAGIKGRDVTSAAYAAEFGNQERYRANGNIYNFAGDVIGTYKQPQNTSNIVVQDGFTGTPGYAGGYVGGGASAPAYDPIELAKYDQAISQIEQARGRLGNQLGIAKDNIGDQFNINSNELKSAYSRAQNDYTGQTTSNQQSLRTNYNNINDVASMGMRGLARLLGSYGATGSDMGLASDAVNTSATAERSGANTVYSQNQRGLDTNWGNFQEEHKNQERRLADWRKKAISDAEAQSKTTEQDLLNQLARLRGEKAQYTGGSFAGAAQSALDQANRLSGQIDQLGRFKPTYSGKTPVYEQRSLDSYRANDNATIDTASLPGANNRYLARLLGEDERKDRVAF